MEVAAGLEPAKTGFADRRLDHFGIATVPLKSHQKLSQGLRKLNVYPLYPTKKLSSVLPRVTRTLSQGLANPTQIYTQNCTQTALKTPIYPKYPLSNQLKPKDAAPNRRFCRPWP